MHDANGTGGAPDQDELFPRVACAGSYSVQGVAEPVRGAAVGRPGRHLAGSA